MPDEDVQVGAELILRDGGDRLLPRTIRYVEERREHERRWTGAIERHPSPLTIVWGDLDPIAVWPMAERVHERRPGRDARAAARASAITRCSNPPTQLAAALDHTRRAGGYFVNSASAAVQSMQTP